MTDSVPGETPVERYCPTCERSFAGRDRCPEDDTVLVRLAAPTDRLVGSEIDARYTIQRRIGSGGMGAVYGAVQHSVGREVAIKVVNPSLVDDPFIIKRFLREAKLTSRLSHPNAVAVLDFGQTPDGLFYLVMELISGRTLSQVLKADGSFTPSRVVRIGSQILLALMGAHQLSIVHRDLKPSNVILLESAPGRDLVKVLDFGLAKSLSHETTMTSMTGSGALLGTPAYMPPEVATGGEADARGDLYSLGVILYQLASGRLPFVGDSVHDLLLKLARETAPPLESFGVPAPLARVIEKMMAKSPADRYPSAVLAQAALDEADDESSGTVARRKSPSGAPRSALPLDDSAALASTHHGGGSAPAVVPMAPTPAPIAAHRSRRRLLLGLVGGLALVVAGVSIAIALGLGASGGGTGASESTAAEPAAPAATAPADARPSTTGGAAVVTPPELAPVIDAAPAAGSDGPPDRSVRDRRRDRQRERIPKPRPRAPDAGSYPF